ncbi:MAG: hypothetical protein QM767_13095 [Anaeromyxobacter sp.]
MHEPERHQATGDRAAGRAGARDAAAERAGDLERRGPLQPAALGEGGQDGLAAGEALREQLGGDVLGSG